MPTGISCPDCGKNRKRRKTVIRWGKRINQSRTTQRYRCKQCEKTFTGEHEKQKYRTYNIRDILNEISNYNLGTPLRSLRPPKSTTHNWIKTIKLPLHRLRNKITTDPIIKKKFFHHKQPFLFKYHELKLKFVKQPKLKAYLKKIEKELPKGIFRNSRRISRIKPPKILDTNIKPKHNYATKLAGIALTLTNSNKERHQIIEDFMLINDTATIATEIPIYLTTKKNNIITGHIDILQVRYHKLYILDYKPKPLNKKRAIAQLILYRNALSQRTKIPESKIRIAFFNETGYFEI